MFTTNYVKENKTEFNLSNLSENELVSWINNLSELNDKQKKKITDAILSSGCDGATLSTSQNSQEIHEELGISMLLSRKLQSIVDKKLKRNTETQQQAKEINMTPIINSSNTNITNISTQINEIQKFNTHQIPIWHNGSKHTFVYNERHFTQPKYFPHVHINTWQELISIISSHLKEQPYDPQGKLKQEELRLLSKRLLFCKEKKIKNQYEVDHQCCFGYFICCKVEPIYETVNIYAELSDKDELRIQEIINIYDEGMTKHMYNLVNYLNNKYKNYMNFSLKEQHTYGGPRQYGNMFKRKITCQDKQMTIIVHILSDIVPHPDVIEINDNNNDNNTNNNASKSNSIRINDESSMETPLLSKKQENNDYYSM